MARDLDQVMASNPRWSYGYAIGYLSGREAANLHKQFAGLSAEEWQDATDDYAHGYRVGFQEIETLLLASEEAGDPARCEEGGGIVLSEPLRGRLARFDPTN